MNYSYDDQMNLIAEPGAGALLHDSILECWTKSEQTGKPVHLTFSGRPYVIDSKRIAATIYGAFSAGARFALEHGHE